MLNLAAVAQVSELLVGHPHVLLITLRLGLAFRVRPELRCGHRACDIVKHADTAVLRRPLQECLQVPLVDAADGVDVSGAAVVLGVVPPQGLVDVGRAEDEQRTPPGGLALVRGPAHELRHEIGHDHSAAGLYVLQSNVLRSCAVPRHVFLHLGSVNPVRVELCVLEGLLDGGRDGGNGYGGVVCADGFCQCCCPGCGLLAAVLRCHVTSHKDLAA
mmetsp:Transcript_98679/g.318184  ORF Transcript_98679/g.318184 Transcript_98679/m.318184 type:complete len:216 (-) Transcript_98679:1505-2152(-)